METFDYESKFFGLGQVRLHPWYIPALKLRYALQAIRDVKGKVLEAGCGAGAMAKAIKYYRPDLEVYGCDISKKSISIAKKDPSGVNFRYGNIYKLPFENNFFDAVLVFDVLEHLEAPPAALGEIKRVLKKGGLFHSVTPCEGSLLNLEGWLIRLGWRAKEVYCGHINKFSYNDLSSLVAREGFGYVRKKYSAHLITQIVDISYFSLISLRGKNVPYTVEGFLSQKQGWQQKLVLALRSLFAIMTYIESTLFSWFPGLDYHLTFRNRLYVIMKV